MAVEGVTEHKGMLLNTAAGMATYMVVARQSELSNHESKLLSHSRVSLLERRGMWWSLTTTRSTFMAL